MTEWKLLHDSVLLAFAQTQTLLHTIYTQFLADKSFISKRIFYLHLFFKMNKYYGRLVLFCVKNILDILSIEQSFDWNLCKKSYQQSLLLHS